MTARRIDDPEYVQGQFAALRALIVGLANLTLDKDELLQQALERLELARTATIASQASDAWLQAIDDEEAFIKGVTR